MLIGSLELLRYSALLTLFNMSDPAMRTGSVGEATASQILAEFPDEEYDLVIMNPPFTSATVGCQRNWTLLRPRKPKRLGVVEAPSEGWINPK